MSSYRNYYDTTFGRRSDSANKSLSETRTTPSRIATKYGSALGSTPSSRQEPTRVKTLLDKDTLHPPVSYKSPIARAGSRSRDPSPSIEKSEKSNTSSSSSYLSSNRLYPRTYTKSATSREGTISPTGSTSNLPRPSISSGKREDSVVSRFGGRSSVSKDEGYKYGNRSSSVSKDDSLSSKYKSSREDLSSGSQKYLNSRFLPKNSVERSLTAYSRPSSVRTHEVSRKNKELLGALHAQQEQEKFSSRPASRCSSVAPEDAPKLARKISPEKGSNVQKKVEMETVKVCTRGTSPTLGSSTQPSFLRSRRMELAKTIEKTITRPKTVRENMVDKEVQSDRLDDSTKSSRFAGASRISATPWTSFLDMKFSSPNGKKDKKLRQDSAESPKSLSRTSSTKSIISVKSEKEKDSRKSLATTPKSKLTPPKQLTDKKQLPPPIPKAENSNKTNSLHSLSNLNKDFRKSVLNMNPDGSKKKIGRRSNSVSSADSDNCDPDASDVSENLTSCKSFHKSSSSSNLPQKSTGDKQRSRRSPSSDVSVGSTTGPSSSEDDVKNKREKMKSSNSSRTSVILSSADDFSTDRSSKIPQNPKLKIESGANETEAKNFLMRALAPVTNLFKANKHQQGHLDVEDEKQTLESKNAGQEKVIWILDPSSDSVSEQQSYGQQQATLEPKSARLIIHRVETSEPNNSLQESSGNSGENSRLQQMSEPANMKYAEHPEQITSKNQSLFPGHKSDQTMRQNHSGEAPWWLDPNQPPPEGVPVYSGYNVEDCIPVVSNQPSLRQVKSGEKPWWLEENAQPPEGVKTYPNWVPEKSQEDCIPANQESHLQKPMMRHVHSGEKPWWLEENPNTIPEGVKVYPNWSNNQNYQESQEQRDESQKYCENPKIQHVQSGEIPWWLQKDVTPPEGVHVWLPNQDQLGSQIQNDQNKQKIRHVQSGEEPWWLKKDVTPPEGVQTYPNWVPDQSSSPKLVRPADSENSSQWQNNGIAYSEPRNIVANERSGEQEFMGTHKLRHIDSGERAWWMNDDENDPEMIQPKTEVENNKSKYAIRHQDSGERAWWLQNSQEFDSEGVPLGDRASPEGLEMPKDTEGRLSPYDNVPKTHHGNKKTSPPLFISRHTNIDEILGGTGPLWSPVMNNVFGYSDEQCREVDVNEVIIHEGIRGSGAVKKGEERSKLASYSRYIFRGILVAYLLVSGLSVFISARLSLKTGSREEFIQKLDRVQDFKS